MNFNFNSFNQHAFQTKRHESMGAKGTILAFVLTLVIFVVSEYFLLIPITLKNPLFLIALGILLLLFSVFNLMFTQKMTKVSTILAFVLFFVVVAGSFISSPIFHANAYQTQLKVDETAISIRILPLFHLIKFPWSIVTVRCA